MENVKKPNKKYLITKILIPTKLPNPIRKTRVLKLVFITIPCLKFWAQAGYTHKGKKNVNDAVTSFNKIIRLMSVAGNQRLHTVVSEISSFVDIFA